MQSPVVMTIVICNICAIVLSSVAYYCGNLLLGNQLAGIGMAAVIWLGVTAFLATRLSPLGRLLGLCEDAMKKNTMPVVDPGEYGAMKPVADVVSHLCHKHHESVVWYENILNTIPMAISVTDMDMRWKFCNTASLRSMNKTSMSEVFNIHCSEKKGNICNTPNCGIEQLRRGNKQVINNMPNGKTMQIDLDFILDEHGKKIGHVELARDITEKLQLEQEAEIAAKKTRDDIVTRLEGVVSHLNDNARSLADALATSKQQAEIASARLSESATAMEEMNSTVLEVASNAEGASDVATSVQGQAHDGNTLVLQTINSLRTVREQSISLKSDMEGLDKQAKDIGAVLTLIRDIADQTNLLALNAAIEAARAGEAGRGFAVVADEVRKLAEKTMSATRDVESAVEAIQEGTSKSTVTVEGAVVAIEEASSNGEQSGHALEQISALAEDSSARISAIAAAATEQSASSEEINRNIAEVNDLSAEIAKSMEIASQQVQDMTNKADELTHVLDDIRNSK